MPDGAKIAPSGFFCTITGNQGCGKIAVFRPRSSIGQSDGLRIQRLRVRISPGAQDRKSMHIEDNALQNRYMYDVKSFSSIVKEAVLYYLYGHISYCLPFRRLVRTMPVRNLPRRLSCTVPKRRVCLFIGTMSILILSIC